MGPAGIPRRAVRRSGGNGGDGGHGITQRLRETEIQYILLMRLRCSVSLCYAVTSVYSVVSGGAIALVLVTSACSNVPELQPIATVEQIMETTVEPVANAVFDAAVWENGVQVGGPKTADDWKRVQANALMLAETTNLLLMTGRAKDRSGWPIRTQALRDAAMEAAKAAEAENTQAIFDAGTHVYQACLGCHLQYIPNLNAPPSKPAAP